MKSKNFGKKLKLNKKTVAKLDQLEMDNNKGGSSGYVSCVQSCGGGGSFGNPVSRLLRCTSGLSSCPGWC